MRSTPPTLDQRLAIRERPRGRSPVMYQTWREILFLHWKWDPEIVQATLPPGLTVDTYDGAAYLGVVPFLMRNIRPRFCPPIPGISNFLETNVRTYVHDERGNPGVWFYSLEANQWLAVRVARRFFNLPYFDAEMHVSREQVDGRSRIDYTTTRRTDPAKEPSRFVYSARGEPREVEVGTLEFFLAERYTLFSFDENRKQLLAGRVHHSPYPLREATVEHWSDRLIGLCGFEGPNGAPDHTLVSRGVKVEVFPLTGC